MIAASDTPSSAIPAAAARAAAWLAQAWAERDADDARLAVEVLALGQLCRLLCGTVVAHEVDRAVALAVAEPDWPAASLSSALIAAVGALHQGNGLAASARRYLHLLAELAPDDRGDANGALVRLALHRAGPCAAAHADAGLDGRLLHGDRGRAQRFLSEIEAATNFGTIAIEAAAPLAILLEGAAIAAFRAYDLPLGMRLLRARRYTDAGHSAGIATCLAFLRLSQCDDGTFGDYDTAQAHMAAHGHRNCALQLKLPVTLQALWTMAELEDPGFRLVRSAFHPHERRSPRRWTHDAERRLA